MSDIKKIFKNISIAIIPFIFLLSIGLIKGDITYHQKIFKTFMIFIFDIALLLIFIINIAGEKEGLQKKSKYFMYFFIYFLFIFIQFIVSFFSKEISYDREYYLANYTFLILFSLFFFIYLKNINEIKIGLLLINVFFIIVLIWSVNDYFEKWNELQKQKPEIFEHGAAWLKVLTRFRPKLSFGNTNYFAGYAIGLLPLVLISPMLWYDKKKKLGQNWLSITTLIIGILAIIPIFFTQTRAALFGCYIGIAVILIPSLILMNGKLSVKIKVPLAILLVIFFLAAPVILLKFPPPIMKQMFGRLVNTMASPTFFIKDRLNGWTGAWGLFKDHPVFGAGLGTTYPASFKYIGNFFFLYSSSNSFKHSHGEYVQVFGESGIFGMILFVSLFGFVIYMLMKRAFSKLYSLDYRFISLGVAVGIISMMVHQIFSLTFRMSVTMTAYFFLIGLGIFLISYSKKALITAVDENKKELKKDAKATNKIMVFLERPIGQKQTYYLIGILLILTIISLFLFLPVFRSEYNMRQVLPLGSKSIARTNYHLKRSIKIKPDNPYAWTQKWNYDLNVNLKSPGYQGGLNEKYFNEIEKDLNKLNSIIPGYQDVWSKYANLYMLKYNYYEYKWGKEQNINDLETSKESLKLVLKYINKSLNMNFLNKNNHLYKLLILSEFDNKEQHIETIKDYFIVSIYLNYAKRKKIVKEKIKIRFEDKNDLELIGENYIFTLNMDRIKDIHNKTYSIKGLRNIKRLESVLNREVMKIINKFLKSNKK